MVSATGDFSKGKVSSAILRIGLPMMAAEFVNVLYNLVDRMYIGHLEGTGTVALTGIGICFPLISLISAFSGFCVSGGAPLSSIARGAGQDEKAKRIQETAFTLMLMVGLFLTLLLFPLAPTLLRLLGGDDETLPYALSYFRIYVLGSVPVLITLGMNSFINAQGFAKTGMLTVIISAVINIILDPIMIYVFNMGVAGAALATVISQLAGAVWVILFLTGKRPHLRITRLLIDVSALKDILKLGITGFTFRMTNSLTQAIVNIMLKAWGGALSTIYVGAMSLISSVREFTFLPANGITNGAQPVMGFNYGAKLYRRVSDAIRFSFLCALCVNTVIWALMMLVPSVMFRVFTDDEQLISVAVHCVRIYFGVFPFMAMQMAGQYTFVALNYPKYALFFSLLRKVFLIVPLTLLLPGLGMGVDGVFWAEFISQLVGATACFLTMRHVIWRHLKDSPAEPDPQVP